MIKTYGDIINETIARSGINTTTTFITDAMLARWVRGAVTWATSYKKWPFTEGRVSTTFTTGAGANSDEWSFEGYKADSFRILQVGGKRFQKLNFDDYQKYLEENPAGTEKVYSDFGKLVFINPNVDVSGTLTAYGQYLPAEIDITDDTAKTVFSDNDEEGNDAIVEKTLSYVKERERKPNEVQAHQNKAIEILENIWTRVEAEQHAYQTKNRSMFERFDVELGDYHDELFREDRFY